jgi:tetratricopeptide (TPR) repeat protein
LKHGINMGVVLQKVGKYNEAVKSYDKALELFPEFSVHWTNKGSDLLELSRYLNALNVLIRL